MVKSMKNTFALVSYVKHEKKKNENEKTKAKRETKQQRNKNGNPLCYILLFG